MNGTAVVLTAAAAIAAGTEATAGRDVLTAQVAFLATQAAGHDKRIAAVGGASIGGDPSIVIPPPPSPHPPPVNGVPAPAAAVGYNTRTLGPDVTFGKNWYGSNIYGNNPASTVKTQNGDGSLTIAGGGNGYNNHLSNVKITNSGQYHFSGGKAFGGGAYFTARLSWANDYNGWGGTSNGWPAFWGHSVETLTAKLPGSWHRQTRAVEWDFMEYWSNTNWGAGLHDWGSSAPLAAKGATMDIPAPSSRHDTHEYGCLWVPATKTSKGYAHFYFDQVHRKEMDLSWNLYDPNDRSTPVLGTTAFSIADVQHVVLIVGTGAANPMTIYSIEVWQKSDANNLIAP